MPESKSEDILLELTEARVIVMRDRERTFTLTCRRIEKADWLAYFAAIQVISEREGEGQSNVYDGETALKLLAETVLVDAKGYKVEGGKNLTDMPNWQTRIPLAHRLQLGRVLQEVTPSHHQDPFLIHAEGEQVLIDAAWSAHSFQDEEYNERSAVRKFIGLKHVVKTPTEDQHKRYNRQASRSLILGGSRKGKTIYAGAQALLCDLYDELILTVDGYSLNGVQLSSRSDIIGNMDLHHKFTAAQTLFNPQSTVTTD